MKLLVDLSVLDNEKYNKKVPIECEWCSKTFYIEIRQLRSDIKKFSLNCHKYCNKQCAAFASNKATKDSCAQCNKELFTSPYRKRQSKSGRSFCSRSCAATYNNTHKTKGTRRSKLEVWLEEKLKQTYPDLEIIFNNKDAINSELDIYIPFLKLAVELNGIFHYEPIYGDDKLSSIQNNDNRKFQACLEREIELVIIDVSSLKYFKENNVLKYYEIIKDIINVKISRAGET